MVLEVLADCGDPFVIDRSNRAGRDRLRPTRAHRSGEVAGKTFDVGGADGQPVLSLRAGQRWRAFDHVQPVHLLRIVGHPPAIGEIPRVANHPGSATEEIGVERDDDVGLVEVIDGVARRARRLTEAETSAVGRDRVVLVPAGLRVVLENRRHDFRERRRRDGFGEDPEARTLRGFLGCQRGLDGTLIRAPRADFAAVGDGLRPVRVVQAEDGGLCEHVRGAQAGRMLRIPFDFGRSAHVALDQHRPRDASERDGAREKQGPAGHQIFRLSDVRNDLLWRLRRAGADTGERERGAHQLEEVAPSLRVVPFRRLLREFTVQVVAEVRSVGQLAQAPPVKAA